MPLFDPWDADQDGAVTLEEGGADTRPHIENWVECLRTRRQCRADAETAHRSATICHLVNVARDIGRRLRWNPDKEMFVGDDEANRHPSVTRPRREGYELPIVG